MRNDFVGAPAGTVTLAGVAAAASVSARVTLNPPSGAGLVSVTLPVTLLQPATCDWLLEPGEAPLATAWREFEEETGFTLPSRDPNDYVPLGEVQQRGGKRVLGFAALGDAEVSSVRRSSASI